LFLQLLLSYKHLDEPLDRLDEGRFVFECILAGNFRAFITCRPSSHVHVHLFGLAFSLEILLLNC